MYFIAGFIPPTSGTAIVNGYDIKQDISSVRQSLGLCPQHNVLFDTLTVHEHLVFFAKVLFHYLSRITIFTFCYSSCKGFHQIKNLSDLGLCGIFFHPCSASIESLFCIH